MKKEKIKLLAVGAFQESLGMGRVMRQMAAGLGAYYELHFLAMGCPERKYFVQDGIHYYPVPIPSLQCANYAAQMILRIRPEITLLSIEPIWLPNFMNYLYRFRESTRLVAYLPLEGRFKDASLAEWLNCLDCAVVFTRYSQNELKRITQPLQSVGPKLHTAAIPHGVDQQQFFPLAGGFLENQTPEARYRAKKTAFPTRPELHEGFMVLNPNLTYERKRLDLTIRGFAQFARNKPDNVRLCLHHSRRDEEARAVLQGLVADENIQDRVVFSPIDGPGGGPLSIEQLNVLYNACEVGINTAMGEGWGLTSFEHAATGAAQIVPGHSTFLENWTGNAEMIDVVDTHRTNYPPFEMDVVSVDSVAACLERLYASEAHRLEMAQRAYNHVHSATYNWQNIAQQWDALFEHILSSPSKHSQPQHELAYS